jgi:hypothetical protein
MTVFHFAAGVGFGLVATAAPAPLPEVLALPAAVAPTDAELTVAARNALHADPITKPLALLISVVDARAVVGGAVPNDAVAGRVEAVLRGVPGFSAVRVECWIAAGDDPVIAAARAAARKPDVRPTGAVVVAMKPQPPSTGFLLDPAPARVAASSVDVPPAPPGPAQYPTIPPPQVPVAAADDLATAVETVRTADGRFAKMKAAVSGDVVTISGTAADGAAWDFIAAVRKVPGVARIRLGRGTE